MSADYYAIKYLGKEEVIANWQEIHAKSGKRGLRHRILMRLTHPPIEITSKVYDFFHGKKK